MDVDKLLTALWGQDESGKVTAAVHERKVLLLVNGVPVAALDQTQTITVKPRAAKPKAGIMVIDLERQEVKVGRTVVRLTETEFELLVAISGAQGVISWEELHERIWESKGDIHVVSVHLGNLRRKLRLAGWTGGKITTVHGVGPRLDLG